MKIVDISRMLLVASVFLLSAGPPLLADEGGGLPVNPLHFDSVTQVRQFHNPGLGPNHVELTIDGKSGGKPVAATININPTTGTGARDLVEYCQRDAMLAFHYPDRYTFEIISGQVLNGSNLNLSVGSNSGDNIYCLLKTKTLINPVGLSLQEMPVSKQLLDK